jgi:acetylornithine deacetylase/succinyl-diaminopimelate desuccinylase-like protein
MLVRLSFASERTMEVCDIDDLIEFLRFPSVSADLQFRLQVEACADWLLQRFKKAGLDAEKLPTGGNPVVLAGNNHKPGRKTVLIYGYYDVQPPDPLELWQTPPFEPVIRDGGLIARGSADCRRLEVIPSRSG